MDPKHQTTLERRYVNYLKLGFNREEFVMDFGQYHEGDPEAVLHTGLVTTTQTAQAFLKAIADAVEEWRKEFGGLGPDATPPGGKGGPRA